LPSNSAPARLGKYSKMPINTPIMPMEKFFVGLRPITNYFDDLITGNKYIILKDNSIFIGTLAHIYVGRTLEYENIGRTIILKSINNNG
jgi:hypothetical protein